MRVLMEVKSNSLERLWPLVLRGGFWAGLSAWLIAVPLTSGAAQYDRLKSFGFPDQFGRYPSSQVLEGRDGLLYGTTSYGTSLAGTLTWGTLFQMKRDGSGYKVLHQFTGAGDGQGPEGRLVEGSDGFLYGTTQSGASPGGGTIYRISKDGSAYTIVRSLVGQSPKGGLIEGSDGAFYGTTYSAVYKFSKDGSGYAVLHDFRDGTGTGPWPLWLIEGSDGILYGVTSTGGSANGQNSNYYNGTVFKLNKDGSDFAFLHNFNTDGDGVYPTGLVEGSDGALYGATYAGGTNLLSRYGGGTVFKLSKDGSGYTILRHLGSTWNEGLIPDGALVVGSDGALYGSTTYGGTNGAGVLFRLSRDGSELSVLYNLLNYPYDYAGPGSRPIRLTGGLDRTLYGTSTIGGENNVGTVFKLNEDGSGYALLRSFVSNNTGGDAAKPEAGLVEASDGALYGVASSGGTYDGGALFKLNKDGSAYQVLRSFGGRSGDPRTPLAGLTEASDGILYGTTVRGGANDAGTVFGLDQDGNGYRLLHSFGDEAADGRGPVARLMVESDAALYGTTQFGGSDTNGTVFRLTRDGAEYRTLHHFTVAEQDGAEPVSALIIANDSALYGVTRHGGIAGSGTVFKLNPDGSSYQLIYRFGGVGGDGQNPEAALMQASDGALYGTTAGGGGSGRGTVFAVNLDGTGYRVLHRFGGYSANEGQQPYGELLEGGDGALYGTTLRGGADGVGTVFKLNKEGSGYTILWNFTPANQGGSSPHAGLVKGSDEAFYGTCYSGGDLGSGVVFRLAPFGGTNSLTSAYGWTFGAGNGPLLWNVTGTYQGELPRVVLHQHASGKLTGIAWEDSAVVGGVTGQGSALNIHFSFGEKSDGGSSHDSVRATLDPGARLLLGTDRTRWRALTGSIWDRHIESGTDTTPIALPLPDAMDGSWRLNLQMMRQGNKLSGTATISFSNGEIFHFRLQGSYRPQTQQSRLLLQGSGSDKGASLLLLTSGPELKIDSMRGSVGGQRVRFP